MKTTLLALTLLLGLGASAALAQGAPPGSSSWGDTGSHANR